MRFWRHFRFTVVFFVGVFFFTLMGFHGVPSFHPKNPTIREFPPNRPSIFCARMLLLNSMGLKLPLSAIKKWVQCKMAGNFLKGRYAFAVGTHFSLRHDYGRKGKQIKLSIATCFDNYALRSPYTTKTTYGTN